jgi:hypothetical protein
MAARKKTRQREAQLAFEALSIEGGLLSPDWLARVAQVGAGGQSESDYRIPKGLNLRDEIGRYWRMAQAHWGDFGAGRAGGAAPGPLAERFVQGLLRDSFGFTSLSSVSPVVIAEHTYPIGFSALGERVPVVIAPASSGLDTLSPAFGDDGRRRSAFGLAQEFLNAEDGALWGLATDGVALRIVRDNASLTRPAWIEVDLGRIFTEERYADFAALWLLVHETRFGRPEQPVTDCALESWRNAGREEGTRAREHLRRGVEDALIALGQGFLAHPDNQALRAALQRGALSTKDYFNQLLRLVYRLIFMLTVEERGVLHADGADENATALYGEGYSLKRLRERSVRRSAHDRFADLWEMTTIVFRGVETGEPRLGLPALAGIFAKAQCPALDAAKLENRALLLAVFKLSWLRENSGLSRVNWRDMGPEELGSVYESLLELVPQITKDGRQFAFATGGETKGNARKTTGSYYTPDSLVQVLLDSALEPVVKDTLAKHPANSVEALLSLSIVDPACGSGHFLLAAARRLASHVARMQANGTPSGADYRHALRQVVGRCIYGVDLNPMAVELCKVSLWMEAVEPGLPLTFLNSHIQHGNALVGTTPDLMAKGVPDAAWEPIEGDDTKAATALKKRNKLGAEGQRSLDTLWSKPSDAEAQAVARAVADLESASDASHEALAKKESQWDGILESAEYRHQKLAADAWCAAFVWPKQAGDLAEVAPTNELWRQLRDSHGQPLALMVTTVQELADQYRFFHWHLAFPHVFAKGGFDVVLGNPPWERLKLQTDEWMSAAGLDLSQANNASARDALLASATSADPILAARWAKDKRRSEALDQLARCGGQYPSTATGDMNLYALFAELGVSLLSNAGHGAWVLPIGIVSDKTYARLCSGLLEARRLQSVFGFANERQLFADVMHNFKFVSFAVGPSVPTRRAVFVFGILEPHDLSRSLTERGYDLVAADVAALNPDTLTCPVFVDGRMARVLLALHGNLRSFGRSDWASKPQAMLHMGAASRHFVSTRTKQAAVPVYESKMVHRYNHRFASFESLGAGERSHMLPRSTTEQLMNADYESTSGYFCPADVVRDLGGPAVKWLLVFRRIANPALARTSAFCFLPRVGVGDSLSVVVPQSELSAQRWARDAALQCWLGNSVVFDAVLKQKMGGNNFSEYVWKQLPVPSRAALEAPASWLEGTPIDAFVIPRVSELTITSHALVDLGRDLGFHASPFRWSDSRRRHIEAELDAAAAMAFGLSRPDFETLFGAFPVLMAREMDADGDFTTRTMALRIFDDMVEATRARKAYQTQLAPLPADPQQAYSDGEATIIPFPRATVPRPMPAWDLSILPAAASAAGMSLSAGSWAINLSGEELGISVLAAVLRQTQRASSRADVERAVVVALLPRLLQAHVPVSTRTQWRDLVGAPQLAVASVGSFQIPWGLVVRKALQQHVLQEADGFWIAGDDIDDVPRSALDARALVALAWLATAPGHDADVDHQVRDLRAA